MNKKVVYWILYGVAIAFALAFAVVFTVDCVRYDGISTSAPLDAILLLRALEFLLPSLIALGIGLFVKYYKKK